MIYVCRILFILAFFFVFTSCSKLIDIDAPVANINEENVYSDNSSSISVLTGLYVKLLPCFTGNGVSNVFFMSALSADELTISDNTTNENIVAFYKNKLISNNSISIGGSSWVAFYSIIFTCNAAIEGILSSQSLTASVSQQLLGEALFVRSLCYFYLVNLYGDAPLILGTDPKIAISLPRTKKEDVYKQILGDLKKAQQILSSSYLNGELLPYPAALTLRVRPTKWAATALLSRVYLYIQDYVNAEIESSKVISETALFDTLSLNQVFLKNSKEAIWQLQPVRSGRNNEDAFLYILPANGPNGTSNPVWLSDSMMGAFEPGDKRVVIGNWVNSTTVRGVSYHYAYKYKIKAGEVTEHPVILRLAEQYLIRAEARAQLNKLSGSNSAAADLNVIRARAGLLPIVASTKEEMMAGIRRERRVELFLEGHRWLDMKRENNVDAIMAAAAAEKGTAWESYQQLYPLPFRELQYSFVLQQNNGYR